MLKNHKLKENLSKSWLVEIILIIYFEHLFQSRSYSDLLPDILFLLLYWWNHAAFLSQPLQSDVCMREEAE